MQAGMVLDGALAKSSLKQREVTGNGVGFGNLYNERLETL